MFRIVFLINILDLYSARLHIVNNYQIEKENPRWEFVIGVVREIFTDWSGCEHKIRNVFKFKISTIETKIYFKALVISGRIDSSKLVTFLTQQQLNFKFRNP